MTDDTTEESDTAVAVSKFLSDADGALAEYDDGYADADATLRVLRGHIDELRNTVED